MGDAGDAAGDFAVGDNQVAFLGQRSRVIGGKRQPDQLARQRLFLGNLDRYLAGKPLQNIVDKQLGFVPK